MTPDVADALAGATLPGPRSLRAVLPAALDAVGWDVRTAGRTGAEDRALLGFPAAERMCVVLADGLGFHQLTERTGHAPTLRRLLRSSSDPIHSVIPTTTAAAITALGTGELPGQTGMGGYMLRNPETGAVFSLIAWDGVDAERWQTMPTIAEQLAHQGRELVAVQPADFVNSGLTVAAWRGVRSAVASSLNARVDAAVAELEAGAKAAYLYWRDIDHTGHGHGWQSDRWLAELEQFDAGMSRLLRSVPAGTLVVITADHGMIDPTERIDIVDHPELSAGVDMTAGEERALQIYTSEAESVAQRYREFLDDQAWVLTKEQLGSSGLVGVPGRQWSAAVGDVVVFAKGTLGVGDSRSMKPRALALRGLHGSLTDREMDIPLLVEVV